ncbi:MAG: D-2-hydroxyacid dehydrogenase [Fimbriimonadaceae bacterium]|nr:D-2-hydroxyacid dehydrogenase [Fimbriimonadaceae bacterium]
MKILVNVGGLAADHPTLRAAAPAASFVATPDEATLRREGVDAEICWGGARLPVLLEVARHLRWIASASAGVDRYLPLLADRPEITLTTGAGTFDIPIAEHLLALLLALRRRLPEALRAQVQHSWQRSGGALELAGSTLGIVGLGQIGQALAVRAAALGLTVLAHKRRPADPPPGVSELFYERAGLLAMLPRCDHVAVTAALSPASTHLLDAATLDCLPAHAVVLNIGRGRLIDEGALLQRLQTGRLAGAGLDVFETEPLPATSPLWDLPQVIITPHQAGSSNRVAERRIELFAAQLRRYLAGQPLRAVADRQAGY